MSFWHLLAAKSLETAYTPFGKGSSLQQEKKKYYNLVYKEIVFLTALH